MIHFLLRILSAKLLWQRFPAAVIPDGPVRDSGRKWFGPCLRARALHSRVVHASSSSQPHHADLFTNARNKSMKVLRRDGIGAVRQREKL